MKNIDIFPWNDHFNTGIDAIDVHHRNLVEVLNRVATLAAYQSSKGELNQLLDQLTECSICHFETETTVWRKVLFEDSLRSAHQAEHQKFIDEVQKLKTEYEVQDSQPAYETLGLLTHWLASHILESDRYRAYVVHALEKGLVIDALKIDAQDRLSESYQLPIELILSTYSTHAVNTFNLMREMHRHSLYEEKVVHQDQYRDLLIELASSFINIPLDQIDTAIQNALQKMGRFIGADRAYIFDFNYDTRMSKNTFEWCAHGIVPQIDALQNIPLDIYGAFLEAHSRGEHFLIEDVDALPQGEVRDTLVMQDIKSLVSLSLMEKDSCIGMVGFDAVKHKRTFENEEIALLKVFSALLANVADRKSLETSNQDVLSALKKAQSMAKIGNWSLNHATGKLDWSDEVFTIFEIDKQRFGASYEAFLEAIYPEDREKVHAQFTNSLIARDAYSVTHRLIMKDGRIKVVLEQCEHDFDEAGKACLSVGTVQDITQSKQDEDSLRLAASVFTHTHEAILILSADSRIVDANSAVERITGYAKEELINKRPETFSSGQHPPDYYSAMWNKLNRDGFWSGEIWERRKNGDLYAASLTISTVKGDGNNVLNYVASFSDITSVKEQQKRLEYIAHYDSLTGLANRVLLSDRLEQAIVHTRRNKISLALVYLDLDGFKEVNDTYGHMYGDKLLTILASRMKNMLREGDTIARLGGDEFVIILPDLHAHEDCIPLLQKILDTAALSVEYSGALMQVSASIGVSFLDHNDSADADQLLRFADQAMYQAKLKGKNRFHIFDTVKDATTKAHNEKLANIEHALSSKEFRLYYQPKVNMRQGKVVGLEALIRWHHPVRGIVPPGDFLPTIEGSALSVKVGEWVLEEAISQIAQWKLNGLLIVVSINIDAIHLLHNDFISQIKALLKKHPNVAATDFILEILETSALENISDVITIMQECQKLHLSFSLDDFGTGYSSLTYLKRLPAAELKIDKSFIRDMLYDPEDLALLDGVIGLAESFDRNVVAEGVEDVKQGEFLVRMGCDVAQGYVIAKPMPAENVENWILGYKHEPKWQQSKPLSRDNLPVLYARVMHASWVQKVILYVRGLSLDVPEQNPSACRFGQWLYALGRQHFGAHPKYDSLEEYHCQIHNKACLMINNRAKNVDVLEQEINDLEQLHVKIIDLLQEFIETC